MEAVKKKAAIVTGASSGIGYAVSKNLCKLGYEVFGFGRYFEQSDGREGFSKEGFLKEGFFTEGFHPIVCDVLDTEKLCAQVKEIAAKWQIHVLVNNAGVGFYGLHEELSTEKIRALVRTNLETPLILTQQLLRHLKAQAGYVINVSSVTAEQASPRGCAYGATKAGLLSFSRSLFDEARKYGVKVVTIAPDMTKTNLYRSADFREGDEPEAYLLPEDVAEAVEFVLTRRAGVVVTNLTLRPQLHRITRK